MLQSQLFTKIRKDPPKDEAFRNAQLLIQAGYIHKEMAGVYDFLPLGLKVLQKLEAIIRDNMNKIGGQEIFLTSLQSPLVWEKSGRWNEQVMDIWFKTKLSGGTEVGLASTHEEPLTNLMRGHISSYKDLPVYVYQFQTKFRNELRAKSGLLRGREFLMKDLYSFNHDKQGLDEYYELVASAYQDIFREVGIGRQTFRTFASGGSFTKFSDEFQTLCEAGEDTIYLDEGRQIAINQEIYRQEVLDDLKLKKAELKQHRAIEVGNIFKLGTRFSKALGLHFKNKAGQLRPVVMGSYGIGLGRLMAAIVEVCHDEAGLNWPETVAPFKLHVLAIGKQESVFRKAGALYERLQKAGGEVLYDDRRQMTGGEKLVEADILGLPYRAVVSEKTIKQGKVELKRRSEEETRLVTAKELINIIQR